MDRVMQKGLPYDAGIIMEDGAGPSGRRYLSS